MDLSYLISKDKIKFEDDYKKSIEYEVPIKAKEKIKFACDNENIYMPHCEELETITRIKTEEVFQNVISTKDKIIFEDGNYELSLCEFPDEDNISEKELINEINTSNYLDLIIEAPRLCSICDRVFKNSFSFLKHNITHLNVSLKKINILSCHLCTEKFYTTLTLENHRQEHWKLDRCEDKILHKDLNLVCYICSDTKAFKSEKTLNKHILSMHEKRNVSMVHRRTKKEKTITVKCNLCPKSFYGKSSLRAHITNCHSESKCICDICDAMFKNKSYLKTHLYRVHYDDGKLHSCNVCGKNFKSPRRVRIHKKNSHNTLWIKTQGAKGFKTKLPLKECV